MSLNTRLLLLLLSTLFSFTVLQAQEKTVAGLYNDGLALLKQKDYVGGLALMEQALEKAGPDDDKVVGLAKKNGAIAAYNAANAERKNKAYDAALALYNKGIGHNPDNSSNYEGVARVYEGQGKKVDAVKAYLAAAAKSTAEGKADKTAKREKKAATMVGKLFVSKDYDTAIAAGEAFLSMKDDAAEVQYYVARSYGEKGDAAKSLEHAEKAVTLAGGAGEDKYFYAQATQLEALGRKSDAVAAYKKITGDKYKKQATYKITELGG